LMQQREYRVSILSTAVLVCDTSKFLRRISGSAGPNSLNQRQFQDLRIIEEQPRSKGPIKVLKVSVPTLGLLVALLKTGAAAYQHRRERVTEFEMKNSTRHWLSLQCVSRMRTLPGTFCIGSPGDKRRLMFIYVDSVHAMYRAPSIIGVIASSIILCK
jgi:hypothetical protein